MKNEQQLKTLLNPIKECLLSLSYTDNADKHRLIFKKYLVLRDDIELFRELAKNDWGFLSYATDRVLKDKEVVLNAITYNPTAHNYIRDYYEKGFETDVEFQIRKVEAIKKAQSLIKDTMEVEYEII